MGEPIVLFGHDWGAPIVWNAAVRYPDRFRAVAGLSVPYTPAMPFSLLDLFDQMYADQFFYLLAFQPAGVIKGEFAAGGLVRAHRDGRCVQSLSCCRPRPGFFG